MLLLCGDDAAQKRRVALLLQRIPGLRAIDAGPLEQSRIVEQLTATLIGINVRYRAHAGIHITGPPKRAGATQVTTPHTDRVVLLSGGTGGAKLARGLLDLVGEHLTVIAKLRRRH